MVYPCRVFDSVVRCVALDMDRRHLQILQENTSPSKTNLLSCLFGVLPCDIPISESSVSGILASEVFHFLTGEEIKPALSTMLKILVPGGILCLTKISIHFLDDIDETIVQDFYAKRENGVKWPGVVHITPDIVSKIADESKRHGAIDNLSTGLPSFVHYTEIKQITDEVQRSGFEIVKSENNQHPGCAAHTALNPLACNMIIARKPVAWYSICSMDRKYVHKMIKIHILLCLCTCIWYVCIFCVFIWIFSMNHSLSAGNSVSYVVIIRTIHIIRYRATATLRRPQIYHNTASEERGIHNQREHHKIQTKYERLM